MSSTGRVPFVRRYTHVPQYDHSERGADTFTGIFPLTPRVPGDTVTLLPKGGSPDSTKEIL